jgi:hypothetical protein
VAVYKKVDRCEYMTGEDRKIRDGDNHSEQMMREKQNVVFTQFHHLH